MVEVERVVPVIDQRAQELGGRRLEYAPSLGNWRYFWWVRDTNAVVRLL